MATRKTKGAKGGGTIRQRPDGRWEARYTLGIDPGTGKQIQKSVYGKTQKEVRQKLTAITAEISPYDFLVGFALDVNFGIEQAVSLQLADDICEAPRAEFNFVIGIENFSMTFLNSLKDFSDSLLNGQLSVGVRTLL